MSDRRFTSFSANSSASPDFEVPGGVYLNDSGVSGAGLGGGAAEVERAMNISLLGAAGAGAATFLPELTQEDGAAELAAAWQVWLDRRLAAETGSAFCRVHAAVGEMRVKEILRADRDLDAALDGEEKLRSLEAAQAFLEGREQVRHMPQLARLTEAIRKAEAPGHVTTLFAMQAGLYHVPRLGALVSYAYFEWLGGVTAAGWRGERGMEFFERENPRTVAVVRDLIRGENGSGEAGESSIFCVD